MLYDDCAIKFQGGHSTAKSLKDYILLVFFNLI